MDLLRTWHDEGLERSKIYHNIDPESITFENGEICFAHPGVDRRFGGYRIPVSRCLLLTTDPEKIAEYVKNHPETINAVLYQPKEEKLIRYYSTARPIMPGSFPNSLQPEKIVGFEKKTYCEGIGMDAWGYLESKVHLTEKEADQWDLTIEGNRLWFCVTSSVLDDGTTAANITDTKRSSQKPESRVKYLSRKDIYTDWYGSREEAEAAVIEARTV